MNQGTPVVATSAVGAAAGGLVQHSVNGEVIPERDVEALRESIKRIVSNRVYRERLAAGALRIISNWDNDRMTEGFVEAAHYAVSRRPQHARPTPNKRRGSA